MIDYAVTQREILGSEARPPELRFSRLWVRKRIARSDVWMQELELLNLADAKQAPQEMRNDIAALADDLGVRVPQAAGAWRRTQALLDLVFEIQEALFELGGYRQCWVREEEVAL